MLPLARFNNAPVAGHVAVHMEITDYRFGVIEVGGQTYTTDVIILTDRIRDGWWRQAGHRLNKTDLDDVVAATPAMLVVGTGYYGNMEVPLATRQYLEDQGIEVRAFRSGEAVAQFNRLQRECANIVAALHLTC